jgi:hypothetical protein
VGTVRLPHRICRVHARLGVAVARPRVRTAAAMGVLGDGRLVASITLTTVAAGILIAFVLPGQDELLGRLTEQQVAERAETVRLAMFTGVFNVLWPTVTVLVIVRPASTTGARPGRETPLPFASRPPANSLPGVFGRIHSTVVAHRTGRRHERRVDGCSRIPPFMTDLSRSAATYPRRCAGRPSA